MLYLYQIFNFLQGHLHFFLYFFSTFMENLFKKHPIPSQMLIKECIYLISWAENFHFLKLFRTGFCCSFVCKRLEMRKNGLFCCNKNWFFIRILYHRSFFTIFSNQKNDFCRACRVPNLIMKYQFIIWELYSFTTFLIMFKKSGWQNISKVHFCDSITNHLPLLVFCMQKLQ